MALHTRTIVAAVAANDSSVSRLAVPGTATKLVNQHLVGIHAAASCEALLLGKRLGITDFGLLLSVLDKSWGQSRILARCGNFIGEVEEKQDPSVLDNGGAPMRNLLKDLQFVQTAAEATALRAPLAAAATAEYTAADAAGLSESDIAVLYNVYSGSK